MGERVREGMRRERGEGRGKEARRREREREREREKERGEERGWGWVLYRPGLNSEKMVKGNHVKRNPGLMHDAGVWPSKILTQSLRLRRSFQ